MKNQTFKVIKRQYCWGWLSRCFILEAPLLDMNPLTSSRKAIQKPRGFTSMMSDDVMITIFSSQHAVMWNMDWARLQGKLKYSQNNSSADHLAQLCNNRRAICQCEVWTLHNLLEELEILDTINLIIRHINVIRAPQFEFIWSESIRNSQKHLVGCSRCGWQVEEVSKMPRRLKVDAFTEFHRSAVRVCLAHRAKSGQKSQGLASPSQTFPKRVKFKSNCISSA